jgi:heme/copper-type cytochrome/quinol oxidase subunit 4
MKLSELFNDKNDINEKSVIGFVAFVIMIIFAFADLISGALGQQLVINDIIYNSFVWVVLGSFGIAETGKIFSKKE